ncbi:hypothetical protein CAC42_7074 [Sphaceloma murrayae]|uniref:Uncharacterized protein n=1 Tax=Sphaceloma murrayae TaxID=2082308 RepID=A0A2K1QQS8_9PEZI|nr:hypothetical protein CAC42_7074 [Sphaceloma murrayae]
MKTFFSIISIYILIHGIFSMPVNDPDRIRVETRQWGCDQVKCMECYKGCPNPSFCFQCQTSPVR